MGCKERLLADDLLFLRSGIASKVPDAFLRHAKWAAACGEIFPIYKTLASSYSDPPGFATNNHQNRRNHYMQRTLALRQPEDKEAKLVDYYNRRGSIKTETELVEFYQLLVPYLRRTRALDIDLPGHGREDLILEFFVERILHRNGGSTSKPIRTASEIKLHLKNFVLDLLRKAKADSRDDPDLTDYYDSNEGRTEQGLNLGADRYATPNTKAIENILREANIDLKQAEASANAFIDTLDKGDKALLQFHSCADTEEQETKDSIADRFDIKARANRATKLGITKTAGTIYRGYEKSKVGGWLKTVLQGDPNKPKADLRPEWREQIVVLLQLLCYQLEYKTKSGNDK